MALKITNSSLFTKSYLSIDSGGVQFYDNNFLGSKRFQFSQIECVLMSSNHKLSFQVGKEVFSIETNPDDAVHKTVINALLQEVRRAAAEKSE
jgi:hypothetical protein